MTLVLVMHARLRGGAVPEDLALLTQRLPYAKRLEIERREPGARTASLAGLWLALEGAARLRGRAVDVASLRFPADGKPYLEGGPWFSISHGLQHVAAAVCDSVEVGFDLEEVNSRAGRFEGGAAEAAALDRHRGGAQGRWPRTARGPVGRAG